MKNKEIKQLYQRLNDVEKTTKNITKLDGHLWRQISDKVQKTYGKLRRPESIGKWLQRTHKYGKQLCLSGWSYNWLHTLIKMTITFYDLIYDVFKI